MKKLLFKTALGIALVFSLHAAASAQVSLSINIGRQPAWGPTGYNHVDYYYLPDIESYYDVSTGQYIYQDGGRWIFASSLPPRYRGYDLYSGYKVVVNRPKPYLDYSRDRVTYARYRNWKGGRQPMLRESRTTVVNRTNVNVINRTNNVRVDNRPGNNGGGNHGRPQGQFNNGHDNRAQGGRPGGNGGGHDDHGQGGHPGGNGGGHDDHGHH